MTASRNDKVDRKTEDAVFPELIKKKRKGYKNAIIAAILLGVLVVSISVAPKYVLRWVTTYELEKMGVETKGFETFEVDLWNSEVLFGPVEFWSTGARHGQIGYAGFGYDLINLVKRKAFIQHFIIKAIDIRIDRLQDGSITIGGIEIDQFFAADKEPGEDTRKPWGFGVDVFQLRESRLIFTDFTGGTLTVDADRLVMEGFQSWEPDKPGTFDLDARVNDIRFEWKGTARLFSEDKVVSITGKVEEGTLAKLIRFIGPVGLVDKSGTFDARGTHEVTLFQDNRIQVVSDATFHVNDVDITGDAQEKMQLKAGTANLKTRLSIEPSGKNRLEGSIQVAADTFLLQAGDGASFAIGSAKAAASALDINLQAEKDESLRLAYEKVHSRSDAALPLVDLFVAIIEAVAVELADDQFSARGALSVEVDAVNLSMADEEAQFGLEANADSWTATLSNVATDSVPPKLTVSGQVETTVSGLAADLTMPDGKTIVSSEQVKLVFEKYDGQKENDTIHVHVTGSTDLKASKVSMQAANGRSETDISVNSLSARYNDFSVDKASSAAKFNCRIDLAVADLNTRLAEDLVFAARKVGLTLPELYGDATKTSASVDLSGSIDLSEAKIVLSGEEKDKNVNLGAKNLQADLRQLRTDFSDRGIVLRGAAKTVGSGLLLELPGGTDDATTLAAKGVEASLPILKINAAGENTSIEFRSDAEITDVSLALPAKAGMPQIAVAASSLGLAPGAFTASFGKEISWRGVLDTAVENLSVDLDRGEKGRLKIGKMSASGLQADHNLSMAVGELTLSGVDANLTDQTLKVPADNDDESREGESMPAPKSHLRADRVTIGAGSRLEFSDTSMTPAVNAVVRIKHFALGGFDTARPENHTTLKIDTTIDDATELKIEGWAAPLHSEPDFDLALSVQRLQLPNYSPYSAKLAGLTIDSGDLSVKLKATAARKKLDGLLEVKVIDLDLGPASREAAENFEKTFDSPADFVVAVLENGQGIIALEFPISGTLDRPVLDFSQVVNRAMRGELAGFSSKGKGALFQPIFFQPGAVQLGDGQREKLNRVAKLMTRKPKLSLHMCGRATAEDFSALQKGPAAGDSGENETAAEGRLDQGGSGRPPKSVGKADLGHTPTREEENQLIDLAIKRTRVVRNYLAADTGIDVERLAECRATYSMHDKQPPRVHLSP